MLVSLWYKRVISRTIFSSLDKCEWEASVARHPASEWNFLDPHYIKCISTYVAVHINVKFMTSLMIIHAFNSFTYFFFIFILIQFKNLHTYTTFPFIMLYFLTSGPYLSNCHLYFLYRHAFESITNTPKLKGV